MLRNYATVGEPFDKRYEIVSSDIEVHPDIRLIHTPGHTKGSMSVIVDAENARYAITGDAIPTKANYDQWVPPGINYDPELALRSMSAIVKMADIIVPGHGAPFEVKGSNER